MTDKEKHDIIAGAVDTFGYESQRWMAVEEMSELADALAKRRRGRASIDDIVTEIADVRIMMAQLSYIYGERQVEEEIESKLARLRERLKESSEEN